MSAISDQLERLQRLTGPDDRKWIREWLNLIRLVEQVKAVNQDVEVGVKERFLALFGPKVPMPGGE